MLVGVGPGRPVSFTLVGSPGPPSEPDVQLRVHPALHVFMPLQRRSLASFPSHVPAARPQPDRATVRRYSPAASVINMSAANTQVPLRHPTRLSRPRTTNFASSAPSHRHQPTTDLSFRPAKHRPVTEPGGWFPHAVSNPSTGSAPNYAPNLATATPQTFTVASRADATNRKKSYHTQPFDVRVRVAARPRSASIQPLDKLEELSVAGSSRTPFCLASRNRTIWQY